MQKGFALPLVLMGILLLSLIGAGGYYLYQTNSWQIENTSVPQLSPQSQIKDDAANRNMYTNTEELSTCIEEKTTQLKTRSEYVKGDVIVLFNTQSFEDSKKLMTSYKLNFEEGYGSDKLNFLNVKVPQGEEFKWICILENNPKVKSVELNLITRMNDCSKGSC